jgi:hypothetical protein
MYILCLFAANDSDSGSGRGQEQHEENKQENHTEWFEPSCSCRSLCSWLLLSSVSRLQILQEMKYEKYVELLGCGKEKVEGYKYLYALVVVANWEVHQTLSVYVTVLWHHL